MKLLWIWLKALLFASGLSLALVIPETSSTTNIISRNKISANSIHLFARAGKCPKVTLVKGRKPSNSKGTPKPPTAKPGSSKPARKKNGARGLDEDLVALALEKRGGKTLMEMNDIATFQWEVGDFAKTIGLHGCSVIALYNDNAIVWGHYSPVISHNGKIQMDQQQILDHAFSRLKTAARSLGILGGTQRPKGVTRVSKEAAKLEPPLGMPNIPQLIFDRFMRIGVTASDLNIASYPSEGIDGNCIIEHAITAGGNAIVTMS